jgi:D-alanyl-D-alanine carboxypeptidase/D-alanyl-D-alanine-endopeptidase (penicillin-binding protein 4)
LWIGLCSEPVSSIQEISQLAKLADKFPYLREVLIGSGSGLLVLTLIIGGFAVSGGSSNLGPTPTESPTASESASPSASPTATTARTCSVAEQASNPQLGTLQAVVLNAETGEVLYDRDSNKPASVMKTLTAAAALMTVGPNYRATTKVMADPQAKSVISLVGGGDVTLSKTPVGSQSIYKDAPKLATLATQVRVWAEKNGVTQIDEIILDSTLFAGSAWESSWLRQDQTDGWISEVTALQTDGDRIRPAQFTSARTGRPVLSAGEAFKKELGDFAKTALLVESETPAGFIEIGSVQSQPMSRWITYILQRSENIQSEMMAKLVSVDLGFDGSFESFDPAFKRALGTTGLDFTGVRIRDASGLSQLNMVSPKFMAELMRLVNSEFADFGQIKRSLSIAGESGTLGSRFKGEIADAAGDIFAKNGYIIGVHTLNGIINAKDGTVLTFAIYALGDTGSDVRTAIDTLATAFYRCGDDLSNE